MGDILAEISELRWLLTAQPRGVHGAIAAQRWSAEDDVYTPMPTSTPSKVGGFFRRVFLRPQAIFRSNKSNITKWGVSWKMVVPQNGWFYNGKAY